MLIKGYKFVVRQCTLKYCGCPLLALSIMLARLITGLITRLWFYSVLIIYYIIVTSPARNMNFGTDNVYIFERVDS